MRVATFYELTGILEGRLDAIEKELREIHGDLTKQNILNHVSLPLPDFKATLPDLGSAIAAAKQENVKVSPKVIGNLQEKLTASIDAPSFWPVAADFINYRSQIMVTDLQSLMRSDLPNCTDHPPAPMKLIVGEEDEKTWTTQESRPLSDLSKGKNGTKLVSALYHDCRFTLDSPEETARIPDLGQQRSYVLTFRHCQIVYRGGQVALLTPNPHPTAITGKGPKRSDVYIIVGQTVRFDNCLFVFILNYQPPSEGQWLTKQLLAQSSSPFIVTTPKSAAHS